MFSYYPQQRLPSYPSMASLSAPSLSSRDRYMAALAEAKAAEADYLREQALQQEELALRRRLQAIELQKHQTIHRAFPEPSSFVEPGFYNPQFETYDRGFDYSFVSHRQQLEEEARQRVLTIAQAEARARAQKQQQQIACLARARAQPLPSGNCFTSSEIVRRSSCKRSQIPRESEVEQLYNRLAGQPAPHKPTALATRPCGPGHIPVPQPYKTPSSSVSTSEPVAVQQVIDFFLGPSGAPKSAKPVPIPAPVSQQPKPQPRKEGPAFDLEEMGRLEARLWDHISQRFHHEMPEEAAPAQPTVQPTLPKELEVSLNKAFADFMNALTSDVSQPQQTQPAASASSSRPSAKAADKAALKVAAKGPASAESTLKKELEARLNNEYEAEVRDTIQALIASLHDTSAPTETASPSTISDKGKAKAAEEETSAATSKDVVDSLNEVSSIETAFVALESDFTFPPQLDFDFSSASSDRSSVHSSDSEGSASSHLAFTARNHPVRFYEQALGSLLTQLDAVSSYGNEELRRRRKEVVSRVEKALDDLEWEVQGRWKSRVAKESKAPSVSAPEGPTPAAAPSQETPTVADDARKVDVVQDQTPEEQVPAATTPSPDSSSSASQEASTVLSDPVDVVPEVGDTAHSSQEIPEPVIDAEEVLVPAALESQDIPNTVIEVEIPSASPLASESVPEPSTTQADLKEAVTLQTSSSIETPEVDEVAYPPRQTSEVEPGSISSSLATSVATIKPQPYSVEEEDLDVEAEVESVVNEDVDTFLLPSAKQLEAPLKPRHDDDSASDWSEVEA